MDPTTTAIFLGFVALGAYVQTISGFALGLIVMGATALFQLAPIPTIAIVISLVGLASALATLHGRYREPEWKLTVACVLGLIPALAVGLWLLTTLHAETPGRVRHLLGLVILASGILMMLRPRPLQRASPLWGYTAVGVIAGILGGMFSAPGPPLVLFLYLQPLPVRQIRVTLFSIFLLTSFGRIGLVIERGEFGSSELLLGLLSLPVVLLFTWIGRRWPPPLSDIGARRLAFGLLLLIGILLALG